MDITQTSDAEKVLREAATTALAAPSILNTQPWLWRVDTTGGRAALELRAAPTRHLQAIDSDGRLMILSCGVALHHAQIALTAAGHTPAVALWPEPDDSGLLAQIRISGGHTPSPTETQLAQAIGHRHTDRRPYTAEAVSEEVCQELTAAAEDNGAHLHLVHPDQIATLALAAVQAGALELADPAQRIELANWTHRPPWSGEGVPTDTTVETVPRRVPVRDFAPFGGPVHPAGPDFDGGARYGIVHTSTDDPAGWLAAGQALSAVLLAATARGLATATISDVTEVTVTREQLRQHVLAGIGYPQVAVRIGHAPPGTPPPTAPRKHPADVIT